MAYYLTPAERRARAQNLVQQRKNVVAYKQYLQQQRDYEKQIEQAKLDEENRQKKIDSMDFFTRAVSTVGDLAANVITGALKGLEGIYDLGVGITGAIGGIFSKEFQDTMQKHIATDWVGTYIGDPLQELTKYSYTKNGGIIEGVASGIGQMLPAVIVSVATAGAGAPAAIAEMASLATLGVSAAGNSTEEAYQDGASYYAGLGYGLASGAVEVATEKMFGGFGKLTGAGYLDNVTRSIAKQGAARVAKEFVEEGVEEVVSELANPALKAIYKGGEALEEYKDPEYWKGVGEAGLIGGLTSVAYGQSIGRVMHTSGRYADVSEARQEYETLRQKALNLEENGRIDEVTKNGKTNRQNLYESKMENIRLIENTIKKVDESRREKFIKRAGLEGMFNTDGSVNSEYAAREGLWGLVEQSTAEGDGKPVRRLASQPERYRTAFADEGAMQEALERGGATAFEGEMTPEQARDFGDFKKAFGKIANKSEGYLKFIVSNQMESSNAYVDTQTGTVVIGVDQFGKGTSGVELANAVITSDMWQKSAIHEVKHSTEGTNNDTKLNRHLYSDNAVFEAARDSFIERGYLEERVGKDAQKAAEYLDGLLVKVDETVRSKPKNVSMDEWLSSHLTAEEIKDYRTAQSEISAIAAENVLGNEDFIKKLIRDETNLAQKFLNRIADMREAFSSFKSKDSRAAYTYLQKAEKLYLKAIEEAGGHFSKGRIIGIRQPERDEGIDSNGEMQYNENVSPVQESRKTVKYISYNKIGNDNVRLIRSRLNQIYEGAGDSVADGIAIENGNIVYIVDSGKENGSIRFGVRKQLTISDDKLRVEFIRRANNDAVSKGYVSDELSSKFGDKHYNDRGSNRGQELGEELSTHKEQSSNSERAVPQRDESRRREVKHSLKENIEEEVIKRYGKTYRWSEAGYLLKDGTRVDMSGRNEGAPGGNRTIDHRDIFYDISGDYGTDAMVEFMSRGNIRVIPEYPGINLQVEPTEAQYKQIQSLVETLGWKKKEFSVDFDNAKGDTIDSLNYEGNVSARKVVEDIKYFFKEGKIPYQSELSRFRYSRKDSQGRTLSEGQQKYFADSKVRDDNGDLLVVYHGTMSGDFTVFDASYSNVEGDMGAGFYFSSSYEDVNANYEEGGEDLEAKIERLAEKIESDEEITYEEAEKKARGQLSKSSKLFEVYLDMKNPAYVGGAFDSQTILFQDLYDDIDLNMEDFDSEDDYDEARYSKQDEIIEDFANKVNEMLEERGITGYEEWFNILANDGAFEGASIAQVKEALNNNLYDCYDESGNLATNEVVRVIVEALGYDGIIDNSVVEKWGYKSGRNKYMQGIDEDTRHYIAFKPEQIKLTSNKTPTTNPDIRFSRKDSQGRTLSQAQQDYFAQSKVRDSEGNLLVVYHNSENEFTVFEEGFIGTGISKGASNNLGRGFYFTNDDTYNFLPHRVEAYLNITKPYYLGTRDSVQQWRSLIESSNMPYDKEMNWNAPHGTLPAITMAFSVGGEEAKRIFTQLLKEQGYDGIIEVGYYSSDYVAFQPNQIKLTSNKNPTSTNKDIRFSRKRTPVEEAHRTYYTLSDGQIKKLLANSTHYKVYSKADAEKIINNVLAQYLSFGERYGDISGKTKAEVIDLLWKGLNSAEPGKQMGIALHIADYIIQNSVMEEVSSYDSEVQWAIDIIDALKPYLHSINLDYIKGEIKYRYDRDNSPYLLWGKRKGDSGYGADQIAMELEEKGIFIDAINEADIFFEIDTQYRNAVRALKKKAKDSLAEVLPKDQLKELRQQIAREVLRGFDYTGESSKLSKILDQYKKQISTLYERLRDAKRHNNATNRLLDKVQKIRNWKTGAFVNASKYRPKLFQRSIERLGLIKNRGNLNQSGTRRILAGLAEWYVKDNPVLGYTDSEHTGYYNEEIAAILQAVSQNQKPLTDEQIDLISYLQEKSGITDYKGLLEWYTKENLKKAYSPEVKRLLRELASETTFTTEELIALDKAVGYFGNLIENYNKVIRNGTYVDAKPIAEGYIETFKANKQVKVGWIGKLFDKVFNNGKASYLQTFADPMTVARYMDKYAQGFYTEMLSELRNGTIKAGIMEMNIRSSLDEFLKKHKQYAKGVSRRTVTYRGATMPALDALYLYMTLNRDQALAGLAEAGFTFNNGKEQIRVDGFAKGSEGLTLDELRSLAKEEQDSLYKQFTEEDKEYITIAESIMETCKEAKRETDMLRLGYSNVIEGYYVPIRRANGAITVDSNSTFFDEMNRVSNASFNKDTVRGAKGELYIEGLDEVLDRHIHGISQYSTLAMVIDQYDILYNLNMTEDANKPTTVRTESENVWAKGNDYFKKLISDIQGISPTRGGGSKLFGFFRSNYAKYQLGLNPKVWVTQLSSLFASSSILDYSSIVRGFSIKTPDVDEYCNLAALRNNENSAAMAQGVLESVGKFGDMLMKPIGAVDRFVVKRLFGACQVQVQKNSGLKIGTRENKVKAGELLERVILETQQNALATERSAAMRSGSEMMKTLTMFTADSMKVFGRVVDSLGEVAVLKHKIQATTDADTKAQLQAQLKQANKRARKSITALASAAIFMALVAQAFRWLYGKDDDDDENAIATMAVDAVGNLMGGLPLIKDLYAKLTEGYELQNYSYSAINDLFDAFAGIVNFSEGKPAKKVKDIVFSVGQLFGIPTRNLYNILYGLTKRLSPTTAYEIDNAFYNKNYSSDLKKAIENEDEDMIATIAGLMLDERVGDIESEAARKELNRLVSSGYEVLPRSVNNSITYNGEETALTDRQREQFKKIYSGANSELASLVTSKAYTSASDEVKAKAVNFVYDIYYNLAIEDLLGVDLETKNILFAKAVDISSLAIIVATARNFEADTDRRGNVISGSKKAKVQGYINSLGLRAAQKYMIMGYLGYSNKNGERQVRSYIQTLRLSKSEKEKLFEYSGYAA